MDKLTISAVTVRAKLRTDLVKKTEEKLVAFTSDLYFGKCYCLNSVLGNGGWALSWLIAGLLKQQQGELLIDNKSYTGKKLRNMALPVGIVTSVFYTPTVRAEIRKGLKRKTRSMMQEKEIEVLNLMHLTDKRLDRPLTQLSGERWRASIAIGLAAGKSIYCFPWMETAIIDKYNSLWFDEVIRCLKGKNCLVVVPTIYTERIKNIFDDVINF
jgi:energy-coupling factor transporter ATP-binding protein EcfA2